MASGRYRFEEFVLDASNRQLRRDGAPVELNARYLDALILLVAEGGRLVTKERFMAEVWRGVPVTDEALTQCIKTLRQRLGDDAARPRFIETAPKHGYRFIAPVTAEAAAEPTTAARSSPAGWLRFGLLAGAGMAGGGLAGLIGGLIYGSVGAAQPQPAGAVSVFLVLVVLTMAVGMLGGAGVGAGIAAGLARGRAGPWSIVGGAAGGMITGAVVKLLGMDAFHLLFGQAPADLTGAPEGALLGGAVGFGVWLAGRGARPLPLRRSMAAAAVAGGLAGVMIPLLGGRLLGGSLELLAQGFPDSRLRLDGFGALVGETGFGPVSQLVTGGLEGALFGGCMVGAMILARRALEAAQSGSSTRFWT